MTTFDVIEEYRDNDKIFRIIRDEYPQDPREYAEYSKMVMFHKRYNLPNEIDLDHKRFESWKSIENYLYKTEKAVVVLPVYMLDHSCQRFSTTPFTGTYGYWDSGRVGFIYATREAYKALKTKKIKKEEVLRLLKDLLLLDLDEYDSYANGETWGYELIQVKSCDECGHENEEVLDDCWGFYGSDFDSIYETAGVELTDWERTI